MTTPATLGERVLRRLGVAVVPVAERPALSATISVTAIATQALQDLGVTVAAGVRPAFPATIAAATLATGALLELGVIASDETPPTTDQALALAKLQEVHDALLAQGAASWEVSAIPQAVSEEYIKLTALVMASSFGKQADPAQWPMLESRVKRVALILQAQSLAEVAVAAIHDSLVAQGAVSWDISIIPQAVSDDYAALTSNRLAPTFSAKADPATVPAMEARIRRYSLVQRAPGLATEAIIAVHADLSARGKVRWTVFDIPAAAEQPYVLLAAYKLAPEFQTKIDPSDVRLAEMALNRMIALPTSGERVAVEYF